MTQEAESDPREALVSLAVENREVRQALLEDPKATIRKVLGIEVPAGVEVEVLEERPDKLYVVLPAAEGELTDQELAGVAGGLGAFRLRATRIRRSNVSYTASFSFSNTL